MEIKFGAVFIRHERAVKLIIKPWRWYDRVIEFFFDVVVPAFLFALSMTFFRMSLGLL
jgi:hypothetical protein